MASKTPRPKYQSDNQVKGRWGELIAAFAFPEHWVVRPLPHDFGIDLQVEVFMPVEDEDERVARYRATGGHLACQVKTTEAVTVTAGSVRFKLDTSDLRLAESMGSGAPLLLMLVDRSTRLVHYLCLTDYISVVLNKTTPLWRAQLTHQVVIPLTNRLDLDAPESLPAHWSYLQNLAFRAKLYSVSASFVYVGRELEYALDGLQASTSLGHSRFVSDFTRAVAVYQEALDACDAAIAQELTAADSPYAGLFASAIRWRDSARLDLRQAHALFAAIDPEGLSLAELEEQQHAVAQQIWFGATSFSMVTAIPRTYEQVLRSTRVAPGALC
ncbi:DUF4365 domain-containing protein [Microbacterium sp. NPDC087591]|uniref:DUF4365 domain-containing protein n=1 Tax=Microbacterium sp. NPDC087591 TaxID=3364192 RepID=UPI00381D2BED